MILSFHSERKKLYLRLRRDSNSQSLPPESNALPLGHEANLFSINRCSVPYILFFHYSVLFRYSLSPFYPVLFNDFASPFFLSYSFYIFCCTSPTKENIRGWSMFSTSYLWPPANFIWVHFSLHAGFGCLTGPESGHWAEKQRVYSDGWEVGIYSQCSSWHLASSFHSRYLHHY